jgi:hypothetical protein
MIVDGITSILFVVFAGAIIIGISYSASQSTHRLTGKALNNLPKSFEVVENVKVTDETNKSFIVDYVVINRKGIYLLSIEDRKGIISGDESKPKWKEVLSNTTEEFKNPVKDIIAIIKAMREELGEVAINIPMYPIVVFHKNATFKDVFTDALVVRANEIQSYIRDDENIISNKQLDNVKKKLILRGYLKTHAA